jgi:methionyl-tRNA formyltransferase
MTDVYVVAARHAWNRRVYEDRLAVLPGRWVLIDDPAELTASRLATLQPRYVFLLHWSWRVPQDIVAAHECIGFHMTDLPYGRGGSPLQNLILRGHRETSVTAFRLGEELDAGPIYAKAPLSLDGRAGDIYARASGVAADLIRRIVESRPEPVPQHGEVVTFARRAPEDSRVPEQATPEQLYDFIRMLDAEGYPHAFIEAGGWRCEFVDAALDGQSVLAKACLSPAGGGKQS